MFECSLHVHLCILCVWCLQRPEEGTNFWKWSHRALWTIILTANPSSSVIAVSAFNYWAISPAPELCLFHRSILFYLAHLKKVKTQDRLNDCLKITWRQVRNCNNHSSNVSTGIYTSTVVHWSFMLYPVRKAKMYFYKLCIYTQQSF